MADTFKRTLHTIGDAIVDFSQLNVRTFVGTIKIDVGGQGDPDWDQLMKTAISDGTVTVAASTVIRLDGDSDYFEDPDRITDGLRAAHDNAVAAGQAARKTVLDMIAGRIRDLIEPV